MHARHVTRCCRRALLAGVVALGLLGTTMPRAEAADYWIKVTLHNPEGQNKPVEADTHVRIDAQLMEAGTQHTPYAHSGIWCKLTIRLESVRERETTDKDKTDKRGHVSWRWMITAAGEAKITVHCGGSSGPNGGLVVHVQPRSRRA